jgi:hypothetical protein
MPFDAMEEPPLSGQALARIKVARLDAGAGPSERLGLGAILFTLECRAGHATIVAFVRLTEQYRQPSA